MGCLWVRLIPLLLRSGWRCIVILVSAMELALMGGWPTKDGRAGSGAFEFIQKGSGRKPGAAEAIFFARNLDLSALICCGPACLTANIWIWSEKYAPRRLGGSERRDAILSAQFG